VTIIDMGPSAQGDDVLARARCVADPAIVEVLDRDTGDFIAARSWIEAFRYQDLIRDRVALVERVDTDDPRLLCSQCFVPVYVVSCADDRQFFFRHRRESGSCPAITRAELTQAEIAARKYHGLRESAPHKRIKALIERSLRADPAFSAIASERTWRSKDDPSRFRRPDVQAVHGSGRMAFEVQLSTTFLSVVAGRRAFYRDEGALLIWVLGHFDPLDRRLTTDDILFSNNSNILVVDEETTALSEARGAFHLRCHYRRPRLDRGRIVGDWEMDIFSFDRLTADLSGQRLYGLDYDAVETALRAEGEEASRANRLWIDQQDLFEFWAAHGSSFADDAQLDTWARLRERLRPHGVALPRWFEIDGDFRAVLNAFYSLRAGRPVGWKFNKLIEVAHCVAVRHPRLLVAFGFAIQHFEREEQLVTEDVKGRWRARRSDFTSAVRSRAEIYQPDPQMLPLLRFLCPPVAVRVERYLQRS
jgi:hypothetical protein